MFLPMGRVFVKEQKRLCPTCLHATQSKDSGFGPAGTDGRIMLGIGEHGFLKGKIAFRLRQAGTKKQHGQVFIEVRTQMRAEQLNAFGLSWHDQRARRKNRMQIICGKLADDRKKLWFILTEIGQRQWCGVGHASSRSWVS